MSARPWRVREGQGGFLTVYVLIILSVLCGGKGDLEGEGDVEGGKGGGDEHSSVHIIFSTECNDYFDWQTLGLMHSFKSVGQAGAITRLMACDSKNDEKKSLAIAGRERTHVHPNYALNPHNGDYYTPYNKPYAVHHFLENRNITEDFVAYIDADMVMVRPFTVEEMGARRGFPVAAHYGYLKGLDANVKMGVKEKVKHADKAQKVGGFVIMHKDDLRRLAPLWLKYTEAVRTDPNSWSDTGDIFNNNGRDGPPWISEMYGYAFGSAEAGLQHTISDNFMLYPSYNPLHESPFVMHYGLQYNYKDYAFDKHDFKSLPKGQRITDCSSPNPFPLPPSFDTISCALDSTEGRREFLALYVGHVLHNATYEWARDACGVTHDRKPYVPQTCHRNAEGVVACRALKPGEQYQDEQESLAMEDTNEGCCEWAKNGECENNPGYMMSFCALSCGVCSSRPKKCMVVVDNTEGKSEREKSVPVPEDVSQKQQSNNNEKNKKKIRGGPINVERTNRGESAPMRMGETTHGGIAGHTKVSTHASKGGFKSVDDGGKGKRDDGVESRKFYSISRVSSWLLWAVLFCMILHKCSGSINNRHFRSSRSRRKHASALL